MFTFLRTNVQLTLSPKFTCYFNRLVVALSLAILASSFLATQVSAAETIYTVPGTFTFTVPTYSTLTIEVWGAGGGGGEDNGTNGSVGGVSRFGTVTANGGVGGFANMSGGVGGVATGGEINLSGTNGTNAVKAYSGAGGAGASGGQGGSRVTARGVGNNGSVPGGGGSGSFGTGNTVRAGGGGGGAYSSKSFDVGELAVGNVISITVGSGGAGGFGQTAYRGGNGGNGFVKVTWIENPPQIATSPLPATETVVTSNAVNLSWNGDVSAQYVVNFGTDSTLQATNTYRVAQTATSYGVSNLAENTTYYWRIDSVNAVGTTTGEVWSFTTPGAFLPVPTQVAIRAPLDGVRGVPSTLMLSWMMVEDADQYAVYLDTESTFNNASPLVTQAIPYYQVDSLTASTTYFWRVDTVNSSGTTTGEVWSFTTLGTINTYTAQIFPDIAYGPDPAHVLGICAPTTSEENLPAVILIHGGGWTGGDKDTMRILCNKFAQNGMVGVNINYRLLVESSTSTLAQNAYPSQIADPQLAVRWLRENADMYNINPETICVFGRSAGAHLALLLGTMPTTEPSDVATLYPDQSSHVSCVIDEYGPSDLLTLLDTAPERDKWLDLGNYSTKGDAGMIEASPVYKVNANTPTMMIVQGELDTTVVPEHSLYMRDALQSNDIPVNYISYPNAGHSLLELTNTQRQSLLDDEFTFLSSIIGRI